MKMKIKLMLFLLSIFLIFPFFSLAAEEPPSSRPLNFKDFYQKVLAYYPKLKQQDASVNLAIIRKLAAVSGFLPKFQGAASVTRGDDPVYVFSSLLKEGRFSQDNFELSRLNSPRPYTNYNFSVTGQIPIFDAFQTISRVRSAKLQIDSARFDESFVKMEAFLVASEAYLRTVAVEKLLEIATEVGKASEEDIKQAEDLKEKGLILGADFFAAKVMVGKIGQLKNQLIQEKQAAHILLNILMGEDPFNVFEIKGTLADYSQEAKTLKSWFEDAYKFRPDLASLEKMIEAQTIEVSREKSTALPRVDAFGEGSLDTHKLSAGGGKNYVVGVKATVDIFDPSHSSRVRGQKEMLKKLESDKTMLKDVIAKDLANEYAHYQTVENNLPVTQEMLEDANQAVELMLPLYREGRKSIADLLQIRASYLDVAKAYYALAIDTRASQTRLLFLSGELNESRMDVLAGSIGE